MEIRRYLIDKFGYPATNFEKQKDQDEVTFWVGNNLTIAVDFNKGDQELPSLVRVWIYSELFTIYNAVENM